MKNKLLYWGALVTLVFLWLPVTAWAVDSPVGVAYRGHIQDRGDYPLDGSWIDSPEIIGTKGESKRIEGFEIKLTGTVPDGMELRYNVHVQNKGWLFDEDDCTDWPKDGTYCGTRGDSLRIEAVKLVLTDSEGQAVPGYSVQYRGHAQNVGDLPKDTSQWLADGAQLGTVGSSLRLEALLVQVVKTAVDPPEPAEPVVYDKAGSYGPEQGSETLAGDVTVAADGVTLQNLVITGNLTISEAVGSGTVTLNNVTVKGDTLVRGGGVNSIHINGGQYSRIIMEKTASGAVRIVATGVDGLDVVIAEDACGETIILEGAFASVTVNAPNMTVTTQGATTTIGTLTVGADGAGSTLNLASGTTVADLVLDGKAAIKGQGTVAKAEVKADGVIFEKKPGAYTIEPGVVIPPVFPPDSSGGGGGGTPSKPTLTISDPSLTASKFYDGSTIAAVTAGDLIGVAAGDAGNVTVSATASYDNKNVGSGNKTIRVVYSLGGTAAAKYNKPADYLLTTGTITAKPLTIAAPTLTLVKQYDGNTSAAVTAGELIGKETGDTVTVAATASYDNAVREPDKTITVVYALGGGDAGNYTAPANYQVSNGEITKKQLTVNLTSLTSEKVYDGITTAAAAGTLVGVAEGENVGLIVDAAYDSKDVLDAKTITISYTINGDTADYLAPAPETRPGKITPKPLKLLSFSSIPEKVYDGNATVNGTDDVAFEGKVGTEPVSVDATASFDNKNVGSGKRIAFNFSLTGEAAVTKNYSAPADQTVTNGKITARPLTITTLPTVTTTRQYDGSTSAAVIDNEATDAIASDQLIVTPTANYADKNCGDPKVITINYDLSGADAGNYSALASSEVTGSITPKILTYSRSTETPIKVYDQTIAAPVSISNLTGIVGTEEVSIVSTTATYADKNVGKGKAVTVSATLTGADSGNYQAQNYSMNTGEITAKQLEATAVTVTTEKVYDSFTTAAIAPGWTITGKLGSDDVSATPVANYESKNVGEGKEITVSFSLTGNADVIKNYSAPANQTVTNGKITARPLTITAPNLTTTKPYDGTTSAAVTAGSLTGKESNDTLTVTPTANYDTATHGNGKTITVVYKLEGTDWLNYSAPADYKVYNGVINPRQLTISAPQLTTSKLFDGNANALVTAGTLSGVATGETVIVTTTATYNDAAIGTNKPLTVTYTMDNTTGNYLKPANYTINTGIIKKDILVYSYNGSSWINTTTSLAPVFTSLPEGYTIFDRDNDGVVYAGDSNGTIKKYSNGSWSDAFTNTNKPTSLQFAGIDFFSNEFTALGVDSSGQFFYQFPGSSWELYGTMITKPNNDYQLAGGYYDAGTFYLVYRYGGALYKCDPYVTPSPSMASLALLPEEITYALDYDGYKICGFNYTSGPNMYLTK